MKPIPGPFPAPALKVADTINYDFELQKIGKAVFLLFLTDIRHPDTCHITNSNGSHHYSELLGLRV